MRNIILLMLLLPSAIDLTAQKKSKPEEAFYVMDSNFQGTTMEKAHYMLHSIKKSDTCWRFDTYSIAGPMITSEDYKDSKAQVLHGQVVYFNKKGTRDSIGHFQNGLANGSFYYLNDTGRTYMQKEFAKGVLLQTIDRIKQDSIDDAEEKKKADTSFKKIEVESDFPGGVKGWIKYLTKNMAYPERAQKLIKEGQVWIQFIVDKDGNVYDQEIIKSVEFSLDQEAMRIITESPTWIPAIQNGKKVKSYKKQPITFRL